MSNTKKWFPASSLAYGANAVYIPEYGKPRTIEFILVMVQNYPEFKTHPALDVFHGYVKGKERFEENHEMRVLGWEIQPDQMQWSFLYFPTMQNDVFAEVSFSANTHGRLRMDIDMHNASPEARQWEYHIYINPCEGVELPGFKSNTLTKNRFAFELNGLDMELLAENLVFRNMTQTHSNNWINFPYNVECSEDCCNPQSRYKERIKLTTGWIDIPAESSKNATIEFCPNQTKTKPLPEKFVCASMSDPELPYKHVLWESYHNQQYTRSLNSCDMILRTIPAPQWGKFFIWDSGMTAVGIADFDEEFTDSILCEMPDPDMCGDEIFNHGAFVVTAVYALWELYRNTNKIGYVEKHYGKLRRLVLHMFDLLPGEDNVGMVIERGGSGADDDPSTVYCRGEIFTWDYKETLPVNPDHENKVKISVALTAHAVRGLKILRMFALLLDRNDDVECDTKQIDAVEEELNANYWSEKHQCYLNRLVGDDELLEISSILDYLPLFSGSTTKKRDEILFEELMRDGGHFTENGFILVSPDSPYYRQNGYPNGSAWPPFQYFFWKTCIAMGKMAEAKEIAERYFRMFEEDHRETLCCWEQFRAITGKGAGNTRFSGFLTPIIAMWKAHRVAESLQAGYDVIFERCAITAEQTELHLLSPFVSGKTGVSIVLKPDTEYSISINGVHDRDIVSDSHGWLGIECDIEKNSSTILRIVDNS